MRKIRAIKNKSNRKSLSRRAAMVSAWEELVGSNGKAELIQMLIPIGLEAVAKELQEEVNKLVGSRYERGDGYNRRWGENPGSVYLGGNKVPIKVPRVRDLKTEKEIPLESYKKLQKPTIIKEQVYKNVISGLSARDYEKVVGMLPETFGFSKSSVSQRFKAVSGKKLKEIMERDLGKEDIVAVFLDGKSLAKTSIIIALGITITGEKVPLGFVEASTENASVCTDFFNRLLERGLNATNEILFIIDGAKGLRKAVKVVFGNKAIIQRCQWHKRENVLKYLNKSHIPAFRKKLQSAYEQPTYDKAKKQLLAIKKELTLINLSAVESLEEGLEETLTLHKLGLFQTLGKSFKTTNCIEAINKQIQARVGRVCYWKNSDQRQRWVASVLSELEHRLNKVRCYNALPKLRTAMKSFYQLPLNKVA